MRHSIMQPDRSRCYLCGGRAEYFDPLDEHHVFNAAWKKKSEKYGLLVSLHHNKCHIFGKEAVHNNAANNRRLKADGQRIAMEFYEWDLDEWMELFDRNYL